MAKYKISGVPIVDENNILIGIITNRDIKFETDMSRKIRRYFTDDFKQQIVDLYNAGMKWSELIKEYELTPSTFDKWVRQAKLTGSFKSVDNMTDEQRELIQLRKRNKELEMQLDTLKQAAVIMARKDK